MFTSKWPQGHYSGSCLAGAGARPPLTEQEPGLGAQHWGWRDASALSEHLHVAEPSRFLQAGFV